MILFRISCLEFRVSGLAGLGDWLMFRKMTVFSIVFIIFLFLNYYILRRTGAMWGYPAGKSFYILLGLCCFSYLVTCTLERIFTGSVSAILHTLSGMWLGVGLVFLSCLLVYDAINLIVRLDARTFRWMILFISVSFKLYGREQLCERSSFISWINSASVII